MAIRCQCFCGARYDVADAYADGKLVSVLEGGYNPEALAECVEIHLRELLERDAPTENQERP